ncbi:MAG: hypothetical protein HC899_39110 [Leptolyngbyaceae cyanobacterium SM1_4_3]|nr:hypothetical protein [Leptolyngbyaceae cyanobacterium SM1_4_3]
MAKPGDAVVLTRPPRPTKYQTAVETTYISGNKPVTAKFDVTEDFCRLLGWFCSLGTVETITIKERKTVVFSLETYSDEDEDVDKSEQIVNSLSRLGIPFSVSCNSQSFSYVTAYSEELANIFLSLVPEKKLSERQLPDLLFNIPQEMQKAFLQGAIITECSEGWNPYEIYAFHSKQTADKFVFFV